MAEESTLEGRVQALELAFESLADSVQSSVDSMLSSSGSGPGGATPPPALNRHYHKALSIPAPTSLCENCIHGSAARGGNDTHAPIVTCDRHELAAYAQKHQPITACSRFAEPRG